MSILNWLKQRYFDARILLRYGTLYPEVVDLPGGEHMVCVDPRDPRARKLVVTNPLRGRFPRNQQFWRFACESLAPQTAIDIGANFGECLYTAYYPPQTLVLGVEANPQLLGYLEESRRLHPDGDRIHLRQVLAGEETGPAADFFIHTTWSGGSTATAAIAEGDQRFQKVSVPVETVDNLIRQTQPLPLDRQQIVFKIDVEGFEGHVLRGMTRTLSHCRAALGMMEFDTRMLTAAGEKIEDFWACLEQLFTIYVFTSDSEARPAPRGNFAVVQEWLSGMKQHTDLVLLRGEWPAAEQLLNQRWVSDAVQLNTRNVA
ncbi:MAG: FkbM family methyltransferase [Planctomycetaceae bacterium]